MFNKNKKVDSKVRFQRPNFQKQLENARGYKRDTKKIQDGRAGIFFSKIGLSSWYSKAILTFILIFIIYLIYVPNIFYIKNISVNGVAATDASRISDEVSTYLSKASFLPQQNIFLLSKNKLNSYLLATDPKIFKITSVTKKFPKGLAITVELRKQSYVLQTPDNEYLLSNDGLVMEEIATTSTTSIAGLFIVKQPLDYPWQQSERGISSDQISAMQTLGNKISAIAKSPIGSFELSSATTTDMAVNLSTGYQLKFDITQDLNQDLNYLNLLLGQLPVGNIKNLYYIDLRFKDRGYVCYKNTPCATQNQPIIIPAATSTPDSSTTP